MNSIKLRIYVIHGEEVVGIYRPKQPQSVIPFACQAYVNAIVKTINNPIADMLTTFVRLLNRSNTPISISAKMRNGASIFRYDNPYSTIRY